MANLTTAAGGNGVAGTCTEAELLTQIGAITGSVVGGNLSSTGTTAIRSSVAKTSEGFGSAVAKSNVYSVTQGQIGSVLSPVLWLVVISALLELLLFAALSLRLPKASALPLPSRTSIL